MCGLAAGRGTVPLHPNVRRSPSNLAEPQALVEACSPVQVKALQYHRKPQLIGIGQRVHEDSSADPRPWQAGSMLISWISIYV